MDAIENAYVVSNLDSDFYHNMGLFLVITFCTWFVLSLLLLFVTKKKEMKDRSRIMTLFLYYPSRLAFLVWGPWLAFEARSDLDSAEDNLKTSRTLE